MQYLSKNILRSDKSLIKCFRANASKILHFQYIAHFKVPGGWCLVMEYPPGYLDLFELICDRGRLNEKQTRKIIRQVNENSINISAASIL